MLDSLDHLYANGNMPTIPSGDAAPPPAAAAPKRPPRAELSPEATAAVRQRRIAGAGALAALLLVALLLWPIGLLTGGEDDSAGGDSQAGSDGTEIVGQAVLRPVGDANPQEDAGIAIVTREDGQEELSVQARLQATRRNQAYEVWLYDSRQDAVSLGAQVTDEQGNFAGRAILPDDWRDHRLLDISREPVDGDDAHSGNSVLRTRIASIASGQSP
ncbi:MAG: anti-sigma factor [Thermoleophilaceae bacterium]